MKQKTSPFNRRWFLKSAAAGVTLGTFGWIRKLQAAEPMPKSSAISGGLSFPLRVYSEPFPKHAELILIRSRNAREQLRKSLSKPGARPVNVAVYQMANRCSGEKGKQENLSRMLDAVRYIGEKGTQIMAFPEMCLPGYFTDLDGAPAEAINANHSLADEVGNSQYLSRLQEAAKKARMVLVFGFCEKSEQTYYNSAGVIDANGDWLGIRRKNPLYPYPYETDPFAEPDYTQRSAVFKTQYSTIGVSICFDGEFAESVREMRLNGAELLVWCNAALGDSALGTNNRLNNSGAHAQGNNMWVLCCNCAAKNSSGTSNIVGPNGEHLVILPPDEEAFAEATINLAEAENWDLWRLRLGPMWKSKVKDNSIHPTNPS